MADAHGISGRFFLPGPVEVHPDVLAAMALPLMTHRGPEMAAMLERMSGPLQRLFRTSRPVLMSTSSATGLMESAVVSGVRQRVLVAVGGYFGERFAEVAEACGKEVVRVMVPEGRTLEPDHLARFLDGPDVDAVALVHSETSTGALAQLEELARVVRARKDVMLLVDAVTSLGGSPVETDAWGLDYVFTGTQKALALPPGMALGAVSSRLLERARSQPARGWYLDPLKLEEGARTGVPPQTPAISLLYALDRQLARIDADGGVEPRWERHATMARMVADWCDQTTGFSLMAPAGRRSCTVSAVRLPPGISAPTLVERLADRGYTVTTGLPPLDETVIRIGHMGEVQPADLVGLLGVIEQAAGTAM